MTFKWGILGTGVVAAKFAAGLGASHAMMIEWVASRSPVRAASFAAAFGVSNAVQGYQEALQLGTVDAVYIATPPSEHVTHALAAIASRTPLLVEKPFAQDAVEARIIAEAARDAGVFCMEAMWTRFLPAAGRMRALVRSDAVGEVRRFSGQLGFANQLDASSGSFDPARGGGALAHLGVYPVSLAQWLFGVPTEVTAVGRVGPTGVYEEVAASMCYPGGVLGALGASLRVGMSDFRVLGTLGGVELSGPIYRPFGVRWSPTEPRRAQVAGTSRRARLRERGSLQRLSQLVAALGPGPATPHPYAGNGYHYQAEEVARCVAEGALESLTMPVSDSLAVALTMDRILASMRTDGASS